MESASEAAAMGQHKSPGKWESGARLQVGNKMEAREAEEFLSPGQLCITAISLSPECCNDGYFLNEHSLV